MFYLDAHWGEYLPLADELRIIATCPWSLIVVDDFRVPERPHFGYDTYDGMPIDIDGVASILDDAEARVFFPAHSAQVETGERRGTLVAIIGADLGGNLSDRSFPLSLYKEYKLPSTVR